MNATELKCQVEMMERFVQEKDRIERERAFVKTVGDIFWTIGKLLCKDNDYVPTWLTPLYVALHNADEWEFTGQAAEIRHRRTKHVIRRVKKRRWYWLWLRYSFGIEFVSPVEITYSQISWRLRWILSPLVVRIQRVLLYQAFSPMLDEFENGAGI